MMTKVEHNLNFELEPDNQGHDPAREEQISSKF